MGLTPLTWVIPPRPGTAGLAVLPGRSATAKFSRSWAVHDLIVMGSTHECADPEARTLCMKTLLMGVISRMLSLVACSPRFGGLSRKARWVQ
jgi:hypothetical protein